MAAVRRIIMMLTVAAVMAALMAVASPAFAARSDTGEENRAKPRETGTTPSRPPGLEGESAPPTVPPGGFDRPESVEPKGKQAFTGPVR
jgi:hypothetical protein